MNCLGIESTAHTASLAVVNSNGEILAEARDMYKNEKGGIIPIKAAEHHKKFFPILLEEISNKVKLEEIELISISAGPGLPPCLSEGMKFAKNLASKLNLPIIGVSH